VSRILIIFSASFLLLLTMLTQCSASNVDQARTQAEQTINTAIKDQKAVEAWEEQKISLETQIRDLQMQKTWLEYQNKKYTGYIGEERAALNALETRRKEMEQINMLLEPYLDEVVVKMENGIARDLPFLNRERSRRMAFLKESLTDYHLSLSEKLRRILEAAQVEADYGRTLELIDTSIALNGETIQGRIFRLGRTALFFQSIDKKRIAFFNRFQKAWVPLPDKYERPLDLAMQIVDRKRAARLLVLPVLGGDHE